MTASITEAEFESLVRQSGLTLEAPQRAELYSAYGTLEAMVARVSTPRSRDAEPALIFVPGAPE